jgi:glycosyltransferase involved in cell wall biosynthesis
MKLLFICLSVDKADPITADTIDRVERFAAHPEVEKVDVVSIYGSTQVNADNIEIHEVSKKGRFKIITLINFYRTIISILRKSETRPVAYFYMTPGLLPVFLPIKLLFRIETVIWFGHTQCNFRGRFGIRFCSDKWITSNHSMVPKGMGGKKPRFAGQGVDVSAFKPSGDEVEWDIITVGRITPSKKIHQMLEVIKICEEKLGAKYSLAICGDIYTGKDRAYKEEAIELAKHYGICDRVHFLGSVDHSRLSIYLNRSKIFLFLVKGGIGKASLEAMACGLPAVLASPDARDFFPDDLSDQLLCDPELIKVAERLHGLLAMPEDEFVQLKRKVRAHVEVEYSLDNFIGRVIKIIKEKQPEKMVFGGIRI